MAGNQRPTHDPGPVFAGATPFRRPAAATPDAHETDLAASLHTRSASLGELGRREKALATAEEALTLFRRLYRRWPEATKGDLANAETALRQRQAAAGHTARTRTTTWPRGAGPSTL